MLSFVLVGYSIPLSILFGAIGGLAGGWVMAWYKSKDEPINPDPDPTQTLHNRPVKISGFRLAKMKRDAKAQKRRLRRP